MRRAAFAGLALVLTTLIVSATALAFAAASPHDPAISVVDGSGRRLGADPTVPIGERLTVRVSGFAPQASVTVRTGEPPEQTVSADGHGVATVSFTAARPGRHTLTLFGPPTLRRVPGAGNVRVTVPRVVRFSFHVSTAGVAGTDTARTPRRLADTGIDVVGRLRTGLLAVVVGAVFCLAGRSRRSARALEDVRA